MSSQAYAVVGESAPNPKTKLQQAIESGTAALVAQLKSGKSEALAAYLTSMARFHNYSFTNQFLIAAQKPGATHVAGYQKWLELHRYVKKGEKGIAIFAPMIAKGKRKDSEPETDTEVGPHLVGFRAVHVFDVSQTDGEPLTEYNRENAQGDAAVILSKLSTHIQATGVTILFDSSIAPAQGMCLDGSIKILPGQPVAEEFSTLVHEYAHSLLHRGDRRSQTTQTIRETEAEAVAFIVSTASGLEYGRAASDYIQMWNGNKDTLMESLQHVQGAASEILKALEA